MRVPVLWAQIPYLQEVVADTAANAAPFVRLYIFNQECGV